MFNTYQRRLGYVFPSFDLATAADVVHAKHDKIMIRIGDWFLAGPYDALMRFSHALPHILATDHDGREFRVFSSAGQMSWDVYKGGGSTGQEGFHPLFSGRLTAKRDRAHSETAGVPVWLLRANLAINPTRFAFHQPAHTPGRNREGEFVPRPGLAHPNQCRMSARGSGPILPMEVPLVRSDNSATGAAAGRDMWLTQSLQWPDVLRLYWAGILRTIDGAIEVAARTSGMAQRPTLRNFSFQSVETYWDYIQPDLSP